VRVALRKLALLACLIPAACGRAPTPVAEPVPAAKTATAPASTVAVAAPVSATLHSGEGEGLLLAVDPDSGTLTGYFEMYGGEDEDSGGPRFSCVFFLRGRIEGSPPYAIATWYPEPSPQAPIAGTITPTADGVEIHLAQEHGGCWNVEHFADAAPARIALEHGPWRAIRVVAADKAYFHDAADAATRRQAYVTEHDAVRVHALAEGWVDAEYVGEDGRATRGWLREADLFAALPAAAATP
jgi:hypothetical protein